MNIASVEDAKNVVTFDVNKKKNGWLTELFKDGERTVLYLTSLEPHAFKGYHLHRVRAARYVCIRGKVKITLHIPGTQQREEHILDSQKPTRLFIPKDVATGLLNIGEEEAWLINFPNPAYDPSLKDEQVEYTEEDLQNGIVK